MFYLKFYLICLITFECWALQYLIFSKTKSVATIPVAISLLATIVLAIQLHLDKLI